MARIRQIVIENFRTIRNFEWFPSAGVNCLVGAGDSGKSTILDAIDCCLGATLPHHQTNAVELPGLDATSGARRHC
jgi:putative ATP-dependent endonuclease of OLD family